MSSNFIKSVAISIAVFSIVTGVIGTAESAENISISTFTPIDYKEILSGSYKKKPDSISGNLYLPEEKSGPVSAVVIMHGSGGIRQDTELAVSEAINRLGVATLVVDSFKGRGLSSTKDQGSLPMAATVLDAFQALIGLQNRTDIAGDHVGIIGFSRGGVAALFSNQKPLKQAILGNAVGFSYHIPVYPGCSTQWDNVVPTAAPVLFLLGEKDDLTPAKKCKRYADRISTGGGLAKTIEYPGVSHQFLIEKSRKISGVGNFANCDMGIRDNGEMHYPSKGISVEGDWRGFVRKVFKDCGKKGFTQGGTAESHQAAIADIVKFVQEGF